MSDEEIEGVRKYISQMLIKQRLRERESPGHSCTGGSGRTGIPARPVTVRLYASLPQLVSSSQAVAVVFALTSLEPNTVSSA